VNVADWQPQMTNVTLEILARAFAGNPIHLAAFGADSVIERNRAFFRAGLSVFRGRRLVAMDGPKVRGFGLRSTLRVGSWLSAWARSDQEGPHSHFGPIGVDPEVQVIGTTTFFMTCGGPRRLHEDV